MSGFLGPGQANTSLSSGASQNSCARDFLGNPAVRIQRSHCPWPWGSIPDLGTKIPQGTRGGKNKIKTQTQLCHSPRGRKSEAGVEDAVVGGVGCELCTLWSEDSGQRVAFLKGLPRVIWDLLTLCFCVQSLGHVQLFATPWTVPSGVLCPWNFPDKTTRAGCHFLLQGSSRPRIEPVSPALAGRFLSLCHLGSPC